MEWEEIRDKIGQIPDVDILEDYEGDVLFLLKVSGEDDVLGVRIFQTAWDAFSPYSLCIGSVSIKMCGLEYAKGDNQLIVNINGNGISAVIDLPEQEDGE